MLVWGRNKMGPRGVLPIRRRRSTRRPGSFLHRPICIAQTRLPGPVDVAVPRLPSPSAMRAGTEAELPDPQHPQAAGPPFTGSWRMRGDTPLEGCVVWHAQRRAAERSAVTAGFTSSSRAPLGMVVGAVVASSDLEATPGC